MAGGIGPRPMDRFDLIVVGTGTGLDVANWALEEGWTVAIIERDRPGGTCLNRGCIPSKIVIHSADVAETIRRARAFGILPAGFEVDFPAVIRRASSHVDHESQEIRTALRGSTNPRFYEGTASFVAPKTLRVGDSTLFGERILLATGTRPHIPPIPGLSTVPFLTSTEALRVDHLPRSMTILGGGYIGLEMAHFYGSLGCAITIVQRPSTLANHEDRDVARAVTEAARGRGFTVWTDAEAISAAVAAKDPATGRTGITVTVRDRMRGRIFEVTSETLLVAVGLTPNSDTLNLPATGVEVDARGYIKTDEYLETTTPGIFALGDAVGRFNLKHAANHEALYVIENMRNPDVKVAVDYEGMPKAIFGSPQVAAMGATEQALEAAGRPYLRGVWRYEDTAMGKALEDHGGFVKLLVDPESGTLLGCHIVGPDASILIHEVLVAARMPGGVQAIRDAIHIHPALSEVVHRAANALAPPERTAPTPVR
ncbi:MAG: dihydrolipoyl dehydrogenase family protein [Thermoplasmatota archaeon]